MYCLLKSNADFEGLAWWLAVACSSQYECWMGSLATTVILYCSWMVGMVYFKQLFRITDGCHIIYRRSAWMLDGLLSQCYQVVRIPYGAAPQGGRETRV